MAVAATAHLSAAVRKAESHAALAAKRRSSQDLVDPEVMRQLARMTPAVEGQDEVKFSDSEDSEEEEEEVVVLVSEEESKGGEGALKAAVKK